MRIAHHLRHYRLFSISAMTFLLPICLLTSLLSGCDAIAYRPTVEQGNNLQAKDITRLHYGMSPTQVESAIGSPVYNNIYSNGDLVYVYTLKPGHHKMKKRQLLIRFKNQRLISTSSVNMDQEK